MLKGIKIQIYPSKNQLIYINKLLGSSRFVYNACLTYKIDQYNNDKYIVSWNELGQYITSLKKQEEYKWLNDVHSKVIAQSIIDLNTSYNNFFKNNKGFPKFKSKKEYKLTCRFPNDAISKYAFNGNRINLTRELKDIYFKCSRKDEKYLNKNRSEIRSITLTKTRSNKYYLGILIDKKEINKILPKPNNSIIGIDLGIKDFIVTSNNDHFENIKIIRNNEKKLKKLQRNLSKKVNGSKNKNKARIKLAKFHEKLNYIKNNYLHEVTNELLNENQIIVIEDLSVSGMIKNHNLAKSISELSLYEFKRILKYKAEWYDRDIIEIDKWFSSSKLCNNCGYKYNNLTLNERSWKCPKCNTIHDRDLNAAFNIKNEGLRILNIKENKLNINIFDKNNLDVNNLNKQIGLSSPELTLVDYPTMDDRYESNLKSSDRMKQEKNVR